MIVRAAARTRGMPGRDLSRVRNLPLDFPGVSEASLHDT